MDIVNLSHFQQAMLLALVDRELADYRLNHGLKAYDAGLTIPILQSIRDKVATAVPYPIREDVTPLTDDELDRIRQLLWSMDQESDGWFRRASATIRLLLGKLGVEIPRSKG